MKLHRLSAKHYGKAIGVGILTALILSTLMVTALKTGVSPMPAPVALAFAQMLLGASLPLPVGLLFHVAWVAFWSVFYVVFFWEHLTFARVAALAIFLLALVYIVIFPFIGWGFFGMAIGPAVLAGGFITHLLFAIVLWTLAHWTFGTHHAMAARPYSQA